MTQPPAAASSRHSRSNGAFKCGFDALTTPLETDRGKVSSHRQSDRRSGNWTVAEAVRWHDVYPQAGGGPESAPAELLYRYRARVRGVDMKAAGREDASGDDIEDAPYRCGDSVCVRPPGARCDEQYAKGTAADLI